MIAQVLIVGNLWSGLVCGVRVITNMTLKLTAPPCVTMVPSMSGRQICKSADHLSVPLMRCIHCDVFAYHDTVKQLAKNRSYRLDEDDAPQVRVVVPYWRRLWNELRSRFVSTGPGVQGS